MRQHEDDAKDGSAKAVLQRASISVTLRRPSSDGTRLGSSSVDVLGSPRRHSSSGLHDSRIRRHYSAISSGVGMYAPRLVLWPMDSSSESGTDTQLRRCPICGCSTRARIHFAAGDWRAAGLETRQKGPTLMDTPCTTWVAAGARCCLPRRVAATSFCVANNSIRRPDDAV
jgi:hypothetical protein